MKRQADLLLYNINQLATCAAPNGVKRGAEHADVGLIEDAAVAVLDGVIAGVGSSAEITAQYTATETIDCTNHAVIPGFVDCHTHTVFGGDRVHEFELRIGGATYMEIMAAGGGIVSTMRHTREASKATLFATAKARLDEMLAFGSTTIEIKTGYGLDTATELKMLRVIERLAREHPCNIVPTFLGAHTLPPEYKHDSAGYVALIIEEMLPQVADWYANSYFSEQNIPIFCDVFCEDHAFSPEQTWQILAAGQEHGLQPKIHVDQFNALYGVEMAIEIGCVSADHLDVTQPPAIRKLAQSDTICVPLPVVNFNLGHTQFADARTMIDTGCAVALATDLNPGSAPCYGMPFVMATACRYQRLLPSEALTASTINAAHAIGIGDRVGSIEVGKSADLLILKQADYRHTSYFFGGNPIGRILKNGKLYPA